MAIYYVDPEGAAGTGDGTSFANRAANVNDLAQGSGSNNGRTFWIPDGGNEIRVKKNPDPVQMGTTPIHRRPSWYKYNYDIPSFNLNDSYWIWSTTKGETQMKISNHGLQTGDWIEIFQARWYWNDSTASNTYGDGSSSDQIGNRIPLDGLWKITRVSDDWFKLDHFTAPVAKAQSANWSSIGVTYTGASKWSDVTHNILEPSTGLPIKELIPEATRDAWTASSNVTTYEPWYYGSSWSNPSGATMPPGWDRMNISSSFTTGKCAYYTLPAAIDLSSFDSLSLELAWINGSRKTLNNNSDHHGGTSQPGDGKLKLCLCSDTTGDTIVDTMTLSTKYVGGTYRQGAVEYEKGSALSNNVRSIAVYLPDRGQYQTSGEFQIALTNIIAYSANNRINHRTRFGQNTADDRQWVTPQYFMKRDDGREVIRIGCAVKHYWGLYSVLGYYADDSTWWSASKLAAPLYKMQPFYWGRINAEDYEGGGSWASYATHQRGNWSQFYLGSGTSTTPNKISGGWNRTDMSSRTNDWDITSLDNGFMASENGFKNNSSSKQWQHVHNFEAVRSYGYGTESQYSRLGPHYYMDLTSYGLYHYANHCQGLDFFMQHQNESNVTWISRDSQSSNYTAGDRWKCHTHGKAGNNPDQIGYVPNVTWSVFNSECCRGPYVNGGNNYGSYTINNPTLGGYGRESASWPLQVEASGQLNITGTLKTVANFVNFSGQGPIICDNYIYDHIWREPNHPAGAYSKPLQSWHSWQPNYGLQFYNPNGVVLQGSITKKIYANGNIRINNLVYTGSEDHYVSSSNFKILSANDGGVAGAGKIYGYYWTLEPEYTIRQTSSGKAWKLRKTQQNATAKITIGKVAVAGSGTVTVKLYMYRTATGTSVYGALRIPADATLGITSAQTANNTASAANTWEEVTVTANPTAAGIMNVEVECMTDSSTSTGTIYFDTMTVEQS